MISHISYSNKEATFLSEDPFDGPELSQHRALITIFVYKLKKLPSFQKIVTHYHPPRFAETTTPLTKGQWTRPF